MTIKQKIRQLRTEKRYTLAQVADGIGVKGSTISSYENGTMPPLEKIQKLADFFKVDISYFTSGSPNDDNVKVNDANDSELIEELRSTMDFLKRQIEVMNKEKEQLSTMLELALRGNFPEGSSNISTGEKEVKSLGYTPLKLVG